jgi:hypothetical protein
MKQAEENPAFWAKGNCRHCYGRGIQKFKIEDKGPFSDPSGLEDRLCRCVIRMVEREANKS